MLTQTPRYGRRLRARGPAHEKHRLTTVFLLDRKALARTRIRPVYEPQ